MKTLTHIACSLIIASTLLGAQASAQIQGTGGGEGSGSSDHYKTLGVNPQNIGVGTNTASAGSNALSVTLIALTIGLICGGAMYVTLNKAYARAE